MYPLTQHQHKYCHQENPSQATTIDLTPTSLIGNQILAHHYNVSHQHIQKERVDGKLSLEAPYLKCTVNADPNHAALP